MYEVKDLFDLNNTIAKPLLEKYKYPFEALPHIKEFILSVGPSLDKNEYNEVKENVWVHKTAKVFDSAYLGAPCIIMENAEVRQCAFIRESAIVGKSATVGNSTELKNVILFDHVEVPHYNYVGDSILGYYSHMGAGAVTSNVKQDKKNVVVHDKENDIETGLKKFGAILGDYVEVGCNSVLNPGTIVGKNSNVYPLSSVRGIVPENSIYKNNGTIVEKK